MITLEDAKTGNMLLSQEVNNNVDVYVFRTFHLLSESYTFFISDRSYQILLVLKNSG